jgi:hypothetical protein
MKNALFWDMTPYSSFKNRRFGGIYHLVTANESSQPILVTMIIEAIRSYETSVLTIATRYHSPEDGNVHSHRRENLKSYMTLTGWAL